MNTDRGESDFQIVPSRYNGKDGTWILVDSHGNVEVRKTTGKTFSVTYAEMKRRVEQLLLIDNEEITRDAKSILTFADMRRLEKST